MSNTETNKVHCVLLNMLQWFHQECKNNNLRYYIIGGTMLGAVRHKGFIPWDDDIDVAMPRKDYDKLCSIMADSGRGQYRLEFPGKENKDYTYLFAKIYDTQTTLTENKRQPITRGLYIDVFPLDGIGNEYKQAHENFRKIQRRMQIYDTAVCAFRKHRAWYKNMALIFGRIICPLFVSERKLNDGIRRLCTQYDFDNSEYAGNLVGNWGSKEIMPRSYFGTPAEYDFESIKVYGPEEPDKYLSALYGDYMKLPPEEKRVSHHDYIERDLNKSYLK